MRIVYLNSDSPYIIGKQGETQAVTLRVDVTEWAADFPNGTGVILFTRPNRVVYPLETNIIVLDGKTYLQTIVTTKENNVPGWVVLQAQWYNGETLVKSMMFSGKVLVSGDGTQVDPTETVPDWVAEWMNTLRDAIEGASELIEAAETMNEDLAASQQAASDSEAWARGTRSGEAVESTDDTYHNNSKYYSEQISANAEDVEAWANGTRDGVDVDSDDPAYHKNGKYYNSLAAASAAAAAQSASQAMSDTPEGYANVVASISPDYDGTKTYAIGDYCLNGGKLYRCTTAITEAEAEFDSDHWTEVNVGSEVRDLQSAFDNELKGVNFNYENVATDDMSHLAVGPGGKWTSSVNQYTYTIPLDNIIKVKVVGGENAGVIAFLNSNNPVSQENVDFSQGFTSRISLEAEEEYVTYVKSGMNYLYALLISQDGTDRTPTVTLYRTNTDENVYAELALPYNPNGSYQMGDAVNYFGGLYVAKELSSGEWDGSKWLSVSSTELAKYSLWNVDPSIDVDDVINATTAKWYASGSYRGTITRIDGVKRLCIKAGAVDCLYSLLKSGIVKAGETPYYADGFSGAVRITAGTEVVVNVPDDAHYLYMISKGSTGNNMLPDRVLAYGEKPEKILSGLNVSVIGDSISAFTGTIPSGNLAYYTKDNAGVRVPTEMWWYHFSEITGCKLLINDSWSGSPVTDVRASTHTPMADVSRCQNLHSWEFGTSEDYDLVVTSENIGTLRQSPFRTYERAFQVGDYLKKVTPDVILIAGGGNDYNREAGLGTWDGHTTLDTTDIHTFREAYANMINRMHEVYPNALIVCLKPWYWRQPVTEKEQAIINNSDKTYKDYWDAICEIADLMSCPAIDGITIGFNPWNYYPTFCEDNADKPVHPNAMGQKIMGETVADAMNLVCTGYVNWLKARN